MDWNSEEGRALLWKAYPDGYLDKRGVQTVAGWTYLGGEAWAAPGCYTIQDLDSVRYPGHPLPKGDLLPLPDPMDAATWACLLQDLAEASGRFEHRKPWVGFTLNLWIDDPAPEGLRWWVLTVHDTGGRSFLNFLLSADVSDADGGAEALVHARISFRSNPP